MYLDIQLHLNVVDICCREFFQFENARKGFFKVLMANKMKKGIPH